MDGSINTQNYLINEWGKNPSQNYYEIPIAKWYTRIKPTIKKALKF